MREHLTRKQEEKVQELSRKGKLHMEIAMEFGISLKDIKDINNGK